MLCCWVVGWQRGTAWAGGDTSQWVESRMVDWDVRGWKGGAERVPECLAGGAGKLPSSRLSPACSLLYMGCCTMYSFAVGGNSFLEQLFGLSAKQNPWTARSFHSIQLLPQPHNHKELEIPG